MKVRLVPMLKEASLPAGVCLGRRDQESLLTNLNNKQICDVTVQPGCAMCTCTMERKPLSRYKYDERNPLLRRERRNSEKIYQPAHHTGIYGTVGTSALKSLNILKV